MHSGGILAGWKFSNIKDGVFAEYFHVTTPTAIWRICRRVWTLWKPACSRTWCRPVFHGAELADVQFGDTVLVVGIGPVGLMSVAGAALAAQPESSQSERGPSA